MITILVVGPSGTQLSAFAGSHPSVEILTAVETEDALERLARNRRIDAILLLPGAAALEIAETLREEDPAAPPIFAPASVGAIPGVGTLHADEPDRLLELVVQSLETARRL